MKKAYFAALGFILLLSPIGRSVTWTGDASQTKQVTLYSVLKEPGTGPKQSGVNFGTDLRAPGRSPDLNYGSMYIGEELDWFRASMDQDSRSMIRDLGAFRWEDSIKVAVVVPFPKLKDGEQRHFTFDSSGEDGKDGEPGQKGADGAGGDGSVDDRPVSARAEVAQAPARLAQPAGPKIDPVCVKAVVGHVYVIHVVKPDADYYALFRVDDIERGDHCTISWRVIPSPELD